MNCPEESPMEILLIRHGQTPGNKLGRYIGVTDESLSPEGIAAAEAKSVPAADKWIASPMKRCRETAHILSGTDAEVCEGLRECDFGIFENKNYKELSNVPEYQQWIDSGGTMKFPEGEDPAAFRERSCRAFLDILELAQHEKVERLALVVHGGTIMSIMEAYGRDEAGEKRSYFDWQVKNLEGFRTELTEEDCLQVIEKI